MKMTFYKAGHSYQYKLIKNDIGTVKIYYDKKGIMGAGEKHIPWEEIIEIYNSTKEEDPENKKTPPTK